jgi:hypothetical protein
MGKLMWKDITTHLNGEEEGKEESAGHLEEIRPRPHLPEVDNVVRRLVKNCMLVTCGYERKGGVDALL